MMVLFVVVSISVLEWWLFDIVRIGVGLWWSGIGLFPLVSVGVDASIG